LRREEEKREREKGGGGGREEGGERGDHGAEQSAQTYPIPPLAYVLRRKRKGGKKEGKKTGHWSNPKKSVSPPRRDWPGRYAFLLRRKGKRRKKEGEGKGPVSGFGVANWVSKNRPTKKIRKRGRRRRRGKTKDGRFPDPSGA